MYAGRRLNKKKLIKDPAISTDEYYVEVMDSMYLPLKRSTKCTKTPDNFSCHGRR
jgi:hypothetical protein